MESANDTRFQLASLLMQELQMLKQQTLRPSDIQKTLDALPRGLEESYERIVRRIPDSLVEECTNALKWLTFSKRPLFIEELVDACIITPSETCLFDVERRLDPVDLFNNLVGLITIEPNLEWTRKTLPPTQYTVSLAHFSVREFLVPPRPLREIRLHGLTNFDAKLAHNFVAKSCLAYLAHCALAGNQISRGYALRDYAWHWWAGHAASGIHEDTVYATRFALRLFNAVVFPMLYNGPMGEIESSSSEVYAQLLNLTSWLSPLRQEALRKVLADPTFPNVPQDSVSESASGPQSVLRTLPDDHRALRLLVVHPPKYGEYGRIEGSLCVDSLDNSPLYTALSYTWQGSRYHPSRNETHFDAGPNETSAIKINGKDIILRPNLFAALLRLRLPDRPLVIWVDSVCISMEDLAERSAQVQRMSDIYRNAREVAVWLGEESDTSREAM